MVPAKLLLVPSWGTFVMSRFNVTAPLVPPPVRSVPAVTPVMVPPLVALAQTQAVAFHCNTWPVAQVLIRPRLRLPVLPPPVSPLPLAVVTPVMVPVPGNVCAELKVTTPLLATFSPVSAGDDPPEPNSKFKVADGVGESLAVGSAIHWNSSFTADWLLLLNAEAERFSGCEFFPAVAVAVPFEGSVKVPRTVAPPLTSSVVEGVFVLMPTLAVVPDPD